MRNFEKLHLLLKMLSISFTSLLIVASLPLTIAQVPPSDLFKVPAVVSTQKGPQLIPEASFSLSEQNRTTDPFLRPNIYTPRNYIVPQYDAFDTETQRPVTLPEPAVNTPPIADFTIITPNGLGSMPVGGMASGTTNTLFTFDASSSRDNEENFATLEARWDFENDGKWDTFFSRIKRIEHRYKKAGVYQVKLEILDSDGNVSSKIHTVTVVNNTKPFAYFTVNQNNGTRGTLFSFDTSLSYDSQYQKNQLVYRFDWNSDGKWDTPFQNTTRWTHQFDQTGSLKVTMEVKDPEGLKDQAFLTVNIQKDLPPVASFIIKRASTQAGRNLNQFIFDASASHDDHTPKQNLLFRWDFNYTGPDDIIFDTSFINSPKYSGQYILGGHKTVRLQVMDQDNNISQSFASFDVPWIKSLIGILSRY